MSRRTENLDCKIYVGDLPPDASRAELEEAFSYYGPLRNCWVARRPPGFAFVEFENTRDAEDATRAMDGRMLCGRRVRCELSSGRSRWPGGRPPAHLLRGPPPRWGTDRRDDRCYECGRPGHTARECRERRASDRGRSRSRSRSPGARTGRRGGGRRSPSRSRSPVDKKRPRSRSDSPASPRRSSKRRSASPVAE